MTTANNEMDNHKEPRVTEQAITANNAIDLKEIFAAIDEAQRLNRYNESSFSIGVAVARLKCLADDYRARQAAPEASTEPVGYMRILDNGTKMGISFDKLDEPLIEGWKQVPVFVHPAPTAQQAGAAAEIDKSQPCRNVLLRVGYGAVPKSCPRCGLAKECPMGHAPRSASPAATTASASTDEQSEVGPPFAAPASCVHFDDATIEAAALKHVATDYHRIAHLIPNYRCTEQFARLKAFAEELTRLCRAQRTDKDNNENVAAQAAHAGAVELATQLTAAIDRVAELNNRHEAWHDLNFAIQNLKALADRAAIAASQPQKGSEA